jgi:hypothetical protein
MNWHCHSAIAATPPAHCAMLEFAKITCLNMSDAKPNEIIIRGITTTGRTFRPSDWAERLAGILSTFDEDNRLGYSPCVRPITLDGTKCVIVSKRLKEIDDRAYNFLLGFGRENDLVIEDGDDQPPQHTANINFRNW